MNTRGRERLRGTFVSSKQKKTLILLMAKHPQLIMYKASQNFNHKDSQQLWLNIANECNAVPGAKKTWRQWRKCWQDLRSKIKKKYEEKGMVPTYVSKLTTAEQEALGVKNTLSSPTICQETREFVHLDMENTHDSTDDDNLSISEPNSPPEVKLLTDPQVNGSIEKRKENAKHSESCIFNCDMLAIQEQRKLQIKEDYYNFKKDYLKQKLLLLKDQTEALKNIARELSK